MPTANEIDLDAALGAAVDLFSANEGGVRVHCIGVGDDPALVIGDRSRLEHAVALVVEESVRSTRRGGTVTVSLKSAPRAFMIRIEHPASPDADVASIDLAYASTVIRAHRGTFDAAMDLERGMRLVAFSLPAALPAANGSSDPRTGTQAGPIADDLAQK
jgi:hypothetical protein